MGELEEAVETHLLLAALWTRYSALPERWSTAGGAIENGLGWWGGRPEFIESTYHLYQATRDPWYLYVGEMTLRDIKRRCWAKCGWAGIQDVRTGELSDRMESFFLGETTKYLFLLFDPSHPLNKLDAPFVFSTEGHPLILPKPLKGELRTSLADQRSSMAIEQAIQDPTKATCPVPPAMLPFTISVIASRQDLFHAANLARLHLMPTPETIESPIVEYSRDHPSISISDVRSPSNYTYFPWTLPLDYIPYNGTCSKIVTKAAFEITFPSTPNTVLGPGVLQRVIDGIWVNSMGGVRMGMIQDVPVEAGANLGGDLFRVHSVNNILLGKDERVYLAAETASNVVNPLDPNFTRIRDASLLDLVVDTVTRESREAEPKTSEETILNGSSSPSNPDVMFTEALDENGVGASAVLLAFNSLLQQISDLIREQPPQSPPTPSRKYLSAIIPTGAGAAPLPDIEDSPALDISGAPQGSLPWTSILAVGENCHGKLPAEVPRKHQILVLKRGGCSFSQKLQNIPIFIPAPGALQLVVVVSDNEDDPALPPGHLIRPWLDSPQYTPSGLLRHHPIPMVMVGGGEQTYAAFKGATGVGIKRRYSMMAQGIPISNVIIV